MVSEIWKRRQAVHIASQLPEDIGEALDVLNYTKRLVEEFLAEKDGGHPFDDVISLSASSRSSLIRPGR